MAYAGALASTPGQRFRVSLKRTGPLSFMRHFGSRLSLGFRLRAALVAFGLTVLLPSLAIYGVVVAPPDGIVMVSAVSGNDATCQAIPPEQEDVAPPCRTVPRGVQMVAVADFAEASNVERAGHVRDGQRKSRPGGNHRD